MYEVPPWLFLNPWLQTQWGSQRKSQNQLVLMTVCWCWWLRGYWCLGGWTVEIPLLKSLDKRFCSAYTGSSLDMKKQQHSWHTCQKSCTTPGPLTPTKKAKHLSSELRTKKCKALSNSDLFITFTVLLYFPLKNCAYENSKPYKSLNLSYSRWQKKSGQLAICDKASWETFLLRHKSFFHPYSFRFHKRHIVVRLQPHFTHIYPPSKFYRLCILFKCLFWDTQDIH